MGIYGADTYGVGVYGGAVLPPEGFQSDPATHLLLFDHNTEASALHDHNTEASRLEEHGGLLGLSEHAGALRPFEHSTEDSDVFDHDAKLIPDGDEG